MTRQQALEELQRIFDRLFLSPVQVTFALSAHQVPEWDSLMQITLVMAVEKEFGVRFRVGEAETAACVGDFVDLILERRERP